MDIRTELENAVNIKQGKKEDIKEYTVRLAETVDREASDATFYALSPEAQAWMDKALTNYKTHQKLPVLPDYPEEVKNAMALASQTATVTQPVPGPVNALLNTLASLDQTKLKAALSKETTPETVKPVLTSFDIETPNFKEELNKVVIGKLAAELKPKKVKKVKVKKVAEGPSSSADIRDVICQNYNLPLSEIEKILTEQNIPFQHHLVRNVLAYVVSTIKTLNSLGLLKNSSLKGLSESARLRELICVNPTWSISEVKQAVIDQKIGCNKATVSVMFYHIKGTISTLKKLGMVD
jgi:hypothetical protein